MEDHVVSILIQGVFWIASGLLVFPGERRTDSSVRGVLSYVPLALSVMALAICWPFPQLSFIPAFIAVGLGLRNPRRSLFAPKVAVLISILALMVASGATGFGPFVFDTYGEGSIPDHPLGIPHGSTG